MTDIDILYKELKEATDELNNAEEREIHRNDGSIAQDLRWEKRLNTLRDRVQNIQKMIDNYVQQS